MEIAQEIEKLRGMEVPELIERYREVFTKEPRIKHREWLWKRISWRIQEMKFGGLSRVAKAKLEELISEIDLPQSESQRTVSGALKRLPKPGDPPVGTVLTRTWHGKEIQVRVVEGGYECEGVVHKTLTAAATAITGSHWNGRLFFGLVERRRTK